MFSKPKGDDVDDVGPLGRTVGELMQNGEEEGDYVSQDSVEQIDIHRKVWDQKELIVRILNRHFTLLEDYGGNWPQWKIDSYPDSNVHDSLEDANKELDPLNLVARLSLGKPWNIQIVPMKSSQFPHVKWSILLWLMSAITLTAAAINWMSPRRPAEGYFASSLISDAILSYTLPVLFALGIISVIQQVTSRKRGTRAGVLVPIFDPSILLWISGLSSELLFWPFGILMVTTLPRMSSRVYKNREDLGIISLVPVLSMLIFGMAYWIIGLILAPEQTLVTSAPHSITPTYFMQVIIPPELIASSVWASPIVLAGACLALMSWLNSLHIPGLPGGRLHISRRTSKEVRDFWTFTFLLSSCFLGAVVYNVFEYFSMWTMIIPFLAALLVLNGTRQGIPFVLDEEKRLSNTSEFRIGFVWGLVLLVALPAVETMTYHDNWNSEIEYTVESDLVEMLGEDWSFSFTIQVVNPSLQDKQWEFSLRESPNQGWNFDSVCLESICKGDLSALDYEIIKINATWNNSVYDPTSSSFLVEVGNEFDFRIVEIDLGDHNGPLSDHTSILEIDQEYFHCVDFMSNQSGNLSLNLDQVNSSLFSFESSNSQVVEIDEGNNQICIDAREEILFKTRDTFEISFNNSTYLVGLSEDVEKSLIIPPAGWHLNGSEIGWTDSFANGGELILNDYNCTFSPLMGPSMPQEGEWVWNMSNRSMASIPSLGNDSLRLILPDDSSLLLCDNDFNIVANFSVEYGPDILVNHSNEYSRIWNDELIWVNFGEENNTFEIEIINPSNRAVDYTSNWLRGQSWSHAESNPEQISPGSNTFSLNADNNNPSFVYLSFDDEEIIFNFISFEV